MKLLHHGILLFDSDLEVMLKVLQVVKYIFFEKITQFVYN